MANNKSTKLVPTRILQVLQKYSDYNHPITQMQIVNYLHDDYGIDIEEKAVGRNIRAFIDAGDFGVAQMPRKGTYIEERIFEDTELQALIEAVFSSKYIAAKDSKKMTEKLAQLSSKYFKDEFDFAGNINSLDYRGKTNNPALFYNLEVINQAIKKHKKIDFKYNKYQYDMKLRPTVDMSISPYGLVVKNQKYYVLGYSEEFNNKVNLRIDKISNIKLSNETAYPIKSVKGYEKGIDYKKITDSMPYMYTDEPVMVSFTIDEYLVDQMVDFLGNDILVKKTSIPDRVETCAKVSPTAMKFLAQQYMEEMEILAPPSLRTELKRVAEVGLAKYK